MFPRLLNNQKIYARPFQNLPKINQAFKISSKLLDNLKETGFGNTFSFPMMDLCLSKPIYGPDRIFPEKNSSIFGRNHDYTIKDFDVVCPLGSGMS
jgi:hypothetical protein